MSEIQTNKYLYKSQAGQYTTSEDLTNVQESIMDVIDDRWNNALSTSGYIADCILSAKRFYTLKTEVFTVAGDDSISYNKLIVGGPEEDSVFFIPSGVNNYTKKTIRKRLEYTFTDIGESGNISSGKVSTGNFLIFIDFSVQDHEQILAAPVRITDSEGEFKQYTFARDNNPVNVESSPIWWDTTNNKMKQYIDNTWVEKSYSIPVGLVYVKNNSVESIVSDFNISGYADKVIWVNPGITFGIPTGRDDKNAIVLREVTTGVGANNEFPNYVIVDEADKLIVHSENHNILDSISTMQLEHTCRDDRTLTIYKNGEVSEGEIDENDKIDSSIYTLAPDLLTIHFNPPITNINSLHANYYEQPTDISIFVSSSGELINPSMTKEYSYNQNLGHYVDSLNHKVECSRLGYFSLGYVASKTKFTNEPLTIIEYNSKQRPTLADTSDVQRMIEQYNNNLDSSVNIAITSIANLNTKMDNLNNNLAQEVAKISSRSFVPMSQSQQSANTYEVSNNLKFTGNISFTNPISTVSEGGEEVDLIAKNVEKQYDQIEIIPMGVKSGSYETLDDSISIGVSVNGQDPTTTTVRIGTTYVKASSFGDTNTVYNGRNFGNANSTYNGSSFGNSSSVFNGTAAKVPIKREFSQTRYSILGVNNSNELKTSVFSMYPSFNTVGDMYCRNLYLGGVPVVSNETVLEHEYFPNNAFAYQGDVSVGTLLEISSYVENGIQYECKPADDAIHCVAHSDASAPEYATKVAYAKDDLITYSGNLYRITKAIKAGNNKRWSSITATKLTPSPNSANAVFSGKSGVRVFGPVKKNDKLYFLNKDMRDINTEVMTDIIQAYLNSLQQGADVRITLADSELKGTAISQSFIDGLSAFARSYSGHGHTPSEWENYVDGEINLQTGERENGWRQRMGSAIGICIEDVDYSNNYEFAVVTSIVNITFNDKY